MPAFAAVPQAITTTFLMLRRIASSRFISSSWTLLSLLIRPRSESATALGCSAISFSMKVS